MLVVLLVLLSGPCWHVAAAVPPPLMPCPDGCRCDLAATPRRVDCSGLGLSTFPASLHFSTQYLDLSYNNITSLPADLGQMVPQLETLLLNHNRIQSVLTFRGLPELRVIDLSHNLLAGSPSSKLVSYNPRILDLRLRYNSGLNSPGHLQSSALEVLDLTGCNITHLSVTAFEQLRALRTLNMSLNPIVTLPENMTVPNLRVLDLTQCNLTSLPANALIGMPKLHYLHIAYNSQLDLPKNPSLFSKSLLQITADHCNIQHAFISNLRALTHAYLSCNKITMLKRENFARNSALLEIDLRQNLIRELPVDVFMHAIHLVSVDLSSNHIESLKYDSFSCCTELKFVNLSRNDITQLPNALTMPTIEILDLSRCRLASLPNNSNFLSSMISLRQLYIHHNEIQVVSNLVSKSLRVLDLSYCYLTYLTNETFYNLVELQLLDLSGNSITSLNANVFNGNKKLGTLYLEDNPWRCNCSDIEFQSLYHLADQLSETGRNQLKCNDPEEFKGKTWEFACNTFLTESGETNNWLLSLTLFMTLVALGGIVLCTKGLVGSGRKATQRRSRRAQEERQGRESDSSDDDVTREVTRVSRAGTSGTQCTPCSEGLRNQRLRLLVESQPPTYEEAVLMPPSNSVTTASTTNIANEVNADVSVEITVTPPEDDPVSDNEEQPTNEENTDHQHSDPEEETPVKEYEDESVEQIMNSDQTDL